MLKKKKIKQIKNKNHWIDCKVIIKHIINNPISISISTKFVLEMHKSCQNNKSNFFPHSSMHSSDAYEIYYWYSMQSFSILELRLAGILLTFKFARALLLVERYSNKSYNWNYANSSWKLDRIICFKSFGFLVLHSQEVWISFILLHFCNEINYCIINHYVFW